MSTFERSNQKPKSNFMKSSALLVGRSWWRLLGFNAAGLLAVVLSACSSHVQSELEGNWNGDDQTETVQFGKDGEIQAVDRAGNRLTGHFEFVDNKHVSLLMSSSSVDKKAGVRAEGTMVAVCKFEIRGGTLTMTDEDGTTHKYRRAR
jgi:hypothetical protein